MVDSSRRHSKFELLNKLNQENRISTTKDLIYGENPEVGERRRISASCQIADFATVAGGGTYRKTAGERMAYKMIHKFHAYKERFGEVHMCVGCGRCTQRCPECISISHTLRKMNGMNIYSNSELVNSMFSCAKKYLMSVK